MAHHHHHVPVPVPVPAASPIYIDHHPPHQEEEFSGYDYAHPHIQYRKDMEELKEWGIEPNEEPIEEVNQHLGPISPTPLSPVYPGSYGPQYSPNSRNQAHNIAYSGYLDEMKLNNQRIQMQSATVNLPSGPNVRQVYSPGPLVNSPSPPVAIKVAQNPQSNIVPSSTIKITKKNPYGGFAQPVQKVQQNLQQQQQQQLQQQHTQQLQQQLQNQQTRVGQGQKVVQLTKAQGSRSVYDDAFYGPIVDRLDEIFEQLRSIEENCRERLVCSMYKNPAIFAPHSNLVSNELSR